MSADEQRMELRCLRDHAAASPSSQFDIVVSDLAKAGFCELKWMMHEITGYEAHLTVRPEPNRDVPPRVSR